MSAELSILSESEMSRRERPLTPPRWHSYYHVTYTLVFCVIGILVPVIYLRDMRPIELLIIPITFAVANFVEYGIHRWPMHRKYPGSEVMLRLHMVHHNYFYEDTYRIEGFNDYAMIVFPPVVLNILAFGLAPILAVATWSLLGMNSALLFYASVMGYYLLMQLIHVLCHVDERSGIAELPGIRYLWVHHKIHHSKRCMTKVNFNFIVPLADLVIGTSTQDEGLTRR